MNSTSKHTPVLIEEVVRLLKPQAGETYFDGTAGYGGHAAAILAKTGHAGKAYLVDRDRDAARALRARFGDRARVLRRDYASMAKDLADEGNLVDMALLDLGVSSAQLDTPDRGFSFLSDGPLDMRMDQAQSLTAEEVVNTYDQQRLAEILKSLGEERNARSIARSIVRHRPLHTTSELTKVVIAVSRRQQAINPATRTFQALRIHVNAELDQLTAALPQVLRLLAPGGRMAVISFHSLEDRIVKEFFNRESRDCICPPGQPVCTCDHVASLRKLTKKVIKGSDNDAFNPRARSAKLRAAVKINKNQREAK